MRFRKYKGIRLSYEKQGLIYFTCRTYYSQPPAVQEKILRLCTKASRENPYALFVLLTTGKNTTAVALQFNIASENTLYNARRRFYEQWDRK